MTILEDVRNFLNIGPSDPVFDGEIIPHISNAIGKLSQNGVAISQPVTDATTWEQLLNPTLTSTEDVMSVMSMMPLYVMLSVKIIFDPPAPSTIPYYQSNLDDTLWRLRLIHDIK